MHVAPVLLISACLVAVGHCHGDSAEAKQLIMLEIERLNYPGEDKVVKRQAQVQYGSSPGQYVVQSSDAAGNPQQVPPEYLTLLHQLSPQQQQQQPNIQQLLVTRNPQGAYAELYTQAPQGGLPPRPPLTPQQEQMRQLQELQANKHIREQQQHALQRALQTGQFQPGFQPQPYQPQQYQQQSQAYPPQPPSYQPQPQQQPSYQPQPQPQPAYQQAATQQYQQPQSLVQYDTSSSFDPDPQYSQAPSPPQYYQTRSIRPSQIPQKFSYSEVKFGTSDIARETLEPRLVSIEQRLQNQVKSQSRPELYIPQEQPLSQPTPPPQPVPQPQPQPLRQVDYSAYNVQPQQQTPTLPQHPQQYLIETTKPEQNEESVVRIPRPRGPPSSPPAQSLYYRPDPAPRAPEPYTTIPLAVYQSQPEAYTTIPRAVYNQAPSQYTPAPEYRPVPPSLPAPDAPSRSAIYVHQSSKRVTTQQPPAYSNYLAYTQGVPRIPTPHGQRPLTASEIKALSKAGFQISPLTLNNLQESESEDISPSNEEDGQEYTTSNSKRQSLYVDERKPPGKYPKRIPKPVPLTETERKLLAEQGIRNLYRVESSESKDAPVTYVLAIDNSIRKRESESTTDGQN